MPRNEMPESDEVLGHKYRLAQMRRMLRFLADIGVDYQDLMSRRVTVDMSPILNARGKIVPE